MAVLLFGTNSVYEVPEVFVLERCESLANSLREAGATHVVAHGYDDDEVVEVIE
jgi:cold shock CspA family protein